jgi:hypothetical protein
VRRCKLLQQDPADQAREHADGEKEGRPVYTADRVDNGVVFFDCDKLAQALSGANFNFARARIAHTRVGGMNAGAATFIAQESNVALHEIDQTPMPGRMPCNPSVFRKLIDSLPR